MDQLNKVTINTNTSQMISSLLKHTVIFWEGNLAVGHGKVELDGPAPAH